MRPSSLLRIERLDALIAELSVRGLGNFTVAASLDCSASSARNYLRELRDAGVVVPIRMARAGTESGPAAGAGPPSP